jgi:hypothetical protein
MPCKKFDSSQFFQALRDSKETNLICPPSFLSSSSFQNKSSSFSQKAASLSKTPLTFFYSHKKIVLFEAGLLAFGSWCPFHIIKDEKKRVTKLFSFHFIFLLLYVFQHFHQK